MVRARAALIVGVLAIARIGQMVNVRVSFGKLLLPCCCQRSSFVPGALGFLWDLRAK
jgi:hypothetical protein